MCSAEGELCLKKKKLLERIPVKEKKVIFIAKYLCELITIFFSFMFLTFREA